MPNKARCLLGGDGGGVEVFKKWCLLGVVFVICVLLTGCGGSDKPTNLGLTVKDFSQAYNDRIGGEARLRIEPANLFRQKSYKKTSDQHDAGWRLANYNLTEYFYRLKISDSEMWLTLWSDNDTGNIVFIDVKNIPTVTRSNMGDIIKVCKAVADTVSQLASGKSLSDEIKIDKLNQYTGNNKFSTSFEKDNIVYQYCFCYKPDVVHPGDWHQRGIDEVYLRIFHNKSDPYKVDKNNDVVPNPAAGNHTIAMTQPQQNISPQNATRQNQKTTQQTIPQSNRPSQQASQPAKPKPKMKKDIPGTKPINGFWEGNPQYPLIAMNNTMTKIADKESAKFRKDGNDEVVTIDVYGFTKKDGQCWQETFTYRRKGGPTVRFSSIAQPDPFPMENANDLAVKEAYKIACEAVGVPFVRQRDTTTF